MFNILISLFLNQFDRSILYYSEVNRCLFIVGYLFRCSISVGYVTKHMCVGWIISDSSGVTLDVQPAPNVHHLAKTGSKITPSLSWQDSH